MKVLIVLLVLTGCGGSATPATPTLPVSTGSNSGYIDELREGQLEDQRRLNERGVLGDATP